MAKKDNCGTNRDRDFLSGRPGTTRRREFDVGVEAAEGRRHGTLASHGERATGTERRAHYLVIEGTLRTSAFEDRAAQDAAVFEVVERFVDLLERVAAGDELIEW